MDDSRLQQLVDRQAISDTVIRYATGIDMRDSVLYRSCFTDEVYFDFTSFSGGQAAVLPADLWVARVAEALWGFTATQHISTNHVITLNGDEAVCVSYMQAQHYLPNDETVSTITLGGYYTNTLVRTAEGWRISRCVLTVTWETGDRRLFELARQRSAGHTG
ncbi:MAG: nuclear transport factor 2 family protein [Dehalococcoidia bacterium]|nr:nuclear transport factor 2 family protein [Dehalococcoidia bacterium]NUQ55244.1 nuclear transport factor 2 family protein [Dehalococcoidia bacterium]